jgi:hypothetical protein
VPHRARRGFAALTLVSVLLGACGSAAPGPSGSPQAPAASRPAATATPMSTPTATPTESPIAMSADAEHIVSRLDELSVLFSDGDGDATAIWGNEEGEWVAANMARLFADPELAAYPTNILAMLTAVSEAGDQTAAIETLLAMRDDVANAFGITAVAPTATPAPTPKPTPAATPKPVTFSKLSDRSWAQVVKSPDKYTGKGYQLWGCIWQFDAATGPGSFLANASNAREEYWNLDGENASFTGTEAMLSSFVEDDMVSMNVVSRGSYSYDTQAGGNTTVPAFEIRKITRRGSCE